jgi:hypothetical protein
MAMARTFLFFAGQVGLEQQLLQLGRPWQRDFRLGETRFCAALPDDRIALAIAPPSDKQYKAARAAGFRIFHFRDFEVRAGEALTTLRREISTVAR